MLPPDCARAIAPSLNPARRRGRPTGRLTSRSATLLTRSASCAGVPSTCSGDTYGLDVMEQVAHEHYRLADHDADPYSYWISPH